MDDLLVRYAMPPNREKNKENGKKIVKTMGI